MGVVKQNKFSEVGEMTLEEQIKHYRKQAGLSQEKMAEKIGVSRQAITKWENGTGTPDIANLMALADLFQISLDELLSNEKSEKKQADYIYESRTEYDIDGKKNFDIKLGGAHTVDLKALILDADFFEWLRQNVDRAMQYNPDALAMIVQKCCAWKASVVAQDEREGGVRAILNFGHTLGHALEKVTGYARWTHGEAIAIGQVFACLLSEAVLQFPSEATHRLIELFGKAQLPTAAEDLPADQFIPQIMAALQMDKKTVCSIPRFVLLKRVGEAVFGNETDEEKVKDILRQVLGEENK